MTLTKAQIEIVCNALRDAIDDRDSYADSLSDINGKPYEGFEQQYNYTVERLKSYKELLKVLEEKK